MEQFDVLVIGSGLSGLISAISAADEGRKVLILTKLNTLLSGNTQYAQGGIIYKGTNDSPDKLSKDIEKLGITTASSLLCVSSPKRVPKW